MVMKSRYTGKCRKCGQTINIGDDIDWTRSGGANHLHCPEAVPLFADVICISGGSGYGDYPYKVGETYWNEKHGYITALTAKSKYYREDGLSFGVGDDRGYIYYAQCRLATDEEVKPLLKQKQIKEAKVEAKKELHKIEEEIIATGEYPDKGTETIGVRIMDTQNIYGGGDWWVLGEEWIWYIRNNGMDGDSWADNNIHTGGAGARGWRISATEEMAEKIIKIAEILK